MTIKEFATSFSSLTLRAVNFERKYSHSLFWKLLQKVDQDPFSGFSLRGDQDDQLREGIGGRGSPRITKSLNFVFLLDISPHTPYQKIEYRDPSSDRGSHIPKKLIPNSFKEILSNILPVACIFSYTIMTFLK